MQAPDHVRLETLYVEVTNRCNSLCTSCVRTYDLAEPEADLPLEQLTALAAGLAPEDRPKRVVLNGVGEATLHRDLPAIVALFSSLGASVLFNTNAVALTGRMAVQLAEAGLSELRISVDGASRDTYRRLRGIDALDRVLRNVVATREALERAGHDRPALSIWFTAARSNLREWPDMVRLTHAAGVPQLYFQRLVYRAGADGIGSATQEEALTAGLDEDERRALAAARELARELGVEIRGSGASSGAEAVVELGDGSRPWQACRRPYQSAYVTANGNVLPCCVAPFSTKDYAGIVLGRVPDTTLSEVFRGARYETFRRAFESDAPFDCCSRCGRDWAL